MHWNQHVCSLQIVIWLEIGDVLVLRVACSRSEAKLSVCYISA